MKNTLLSFNPVSLKSCGDQQKRKSVENIAAGATSSVTLNSPSSRVKKGRGRPPKVTVPPASPVPSVPAQKLPFESVIECLKEINYQNKKLLSFVEVLANKVDRSTVRDNNAVPYSENSVPTENTVLEDVNNRLEKIEQNLNSNTVICHGPDVEKLVEESSTNLELLKGKVCAAVCGEEVTGVDVHDLQLGLYGRNKKCIRISFTNPASKIHLLKKAREKRPEGIFVNEFLTSNKLKIYKNLRQLKFQHPSKIKSVFTRNGNIFYSLKDSNRVLQVSSIADLDNIVPPEEPDQDNIIRPEEPEASSSIN